MTSDTRAPSAVTAALAADRLGVWSVVNFVMSGVAPLTVAAGVVTTAFAVTGLVSIPAAFLVVALVAGVFSVGCTAMGRHITNSGAFYGFVTRGLGRPAGVAAALVALAAYACLQVGLFGAFGPGAADYASAHLGWHVPWWVWALAAWAVVAVLSLLRVELNGRILGVLMGCEVLVILALSLTGLAQPHHGMALSTLNPLDLPWHGLGALAVIATLGCVGFEGAVVLTEECRDRRRTIPIATFTSLALIAVLYGLASWAMAVFYGTDTVVAATQQAGPGALFAMAGGFLSLAGQTLYLTSLFAAMLAFQTYFARYAYSLGREHVLPAVFARVNRHRVPWVAGATLSALGFAVIALYALAGWNPLVRLFFLLGTSGGFGVLVLIAATSVAALVFFARNPTSENLWTRVIAPAAASVVLAFMVWAAVTNYAGLLGVPPDAPEATLLPASFAVFAALGVLLALALRSRRPDVYALIGTGAVPAAVAVDAVPGQRSGVWTSPSPPPPTGEALHLSQMDPHWKDIEV